MLFIDAMLREKVRRANGIDSKIINDTRIMTLILIYVRVTCSNTRIIYDEMTTILSKRPVMNS